MPIGWHFLEAALADIDVRADAGGIGGRGGR